MAGIAGIPGVSLGGGQVDVGQTNEGFVNLRLPYGVSYGKRRVSCLSAETRRASR